MFFKKIRDKLNSIDEKLDAIVKQQNAMVLAQRAANDAFSDIIAEYNAGNPSPFKLDDAAMQEGINNLMGYDPFKKQKRDGE